MCLMDLILFFGIWEHKLKKVYDRNTHVIRSLVGYLLDTQFCPALGPPQCRGCLWAMARIYEDSRWDLVCPFWTPQYHRGRTLPRSFSFEQTPCPADSSFEMLWLVCVEGTLWCSGVRLWGPAIVCSTKEATSRELDFGCDQLHFCDALSCWLGWNTRQRSGPSSFAA